MGRGEPRQTKLATTLRETQQRARDGAAAASPNGLRAAAGARSKGQRVVEAVVVVGLEAGLEPVRGLAGSRVLGQRPTGAVVSVVETHGGASAR